MNVEYIPVGQLKPYEKNARKHAEYDVGQIAESIEQYGFNDPIGMGQGQGYANTSPHRLERLLP